MKAGGHRPPSSIGIERIKSNCLKCGVDMMVMPCKIKSGRGKFCSNKCYYSWKSINAVGEKSNRWKGGINKILSGVRTLKAYSEWRTAVFKRDGGKCVKCNSSVKIQAHHIKKFSTIIDDTLQKHPLFRINEIALSIGELWDISNGVTLCSVCHRLEHKNGARSKLC